MQPNSHIYFYDNYCKIYTDFMTITQFKNTQSNVNTKTTKLTTKQSEIQTQLNNQNRSINRTKSKIRDYLLTNDFNYFVTLTIAKDRNNHKKSKQKLFNYLKNRTNKQSIKYLFVTEYHADRKAIHFHGVVSDLKEGQLVNSGKQKAGKEVYNLKDYNSGFSTVTKIDNIQKTTNYITKYITKEIHTNAKNKKRYYCSKTLKTPKRIYNVKIRKTDTPVYENEFVIIYKRDNIESLIINEKGTNYGNH